MNTEAFEAMCYGPIGDVVRQSAPDTEADPIGVLAAVLGLYSGALNGNVKMDNGRPIVVWTVLAGRSSIGRKGTAYRVAAKVLEPAIGGFLSSRVVGGISSGPSLTQVLYEREEDTAGTEGGLDGRVVVVDEEWSENLKRSRRCPTFSTKLRACWDGATIRHTTTKDSMVVNSPTLGFHVHITPGEWSKYVSASDALGGSFNRLLPVLVEGSQMLPYNHRWKAPDGTALANAYEWSRRSPRSMHMNKEAGKRYDELRAVIEERITNMPESLSCYVERSAEQVVRVAAVLTAAEMRTSINRRAMDAAWAFVQYSMRSVERLVRDAAIQPANGKVVKSTPELVREILTRYAGEATSTLLLRSLGVRVTAASLKAAVEAMPDVQVVRGVSESGRGRKPVIYRLKTPGEKAPEAPRAAPLKVLPVAVPPMPKAPTNPLLALL